MVFTFSLLLFSSLLVFDIYQKCNILCVRATSLKCLQHFYAKQKRERKKYCTCISRQSQRCWPSWMGYIQRACWPRYLTRMWKARHGEKISLQERRLFDDLREKKNYTHSKELVSRVENENISQLNCQRTNRFFFFFLCGVPVLHFQTLLARFSHFMSAPFSTFRHDGESISSNRNWSPWERRKRMKMKVRRKRPKNKNKKKVEEVLYFLNFSPKT